MPEKELIAVLGEPFAKSTSPSGSQVIFFYSRDVPRARTFPTLWVALSAGQVDQVVAQQQTLWGKDQDAIYILGPRFDPAWERSDFETLFP
jgi:hypothetical protein